MYGAGIVKRYSVSLATPRTYSLVGRVCDNTGSCPLSSGCLDITILSYTMNQATNLNQSGVVGFQALTGQASGLTSIVISHINTSESKSITISSSGVIE